MSAKKAGPRGLQEEAERARYAMRSSFYYRAHYDWDALLARLGKHTNAAIKWVGRKQMGISDSAWNRVRQQKLEPRSVFCHPEIIQQDTRLIAYYRCLALLPQKGMQRLAASTQSLEEGRGRLGDVRAGKIAAALNGLISLLIESDPQWTLAGARTAALLNVGTQVNGSWRNEIGIEGARRVKELLVGQLLQSKLVSQMTLTDGTNTPPNKFAGALDNVRGLVLTNNYTIVFGSEPDVAIRDEQGKLSATIEVKYGLDPAGALERYGAAMKSFEAATNENRRVVNVYLASCITPELRRRITEDRLVNQEFNLTEVLGEAPRREEFLAYVRKTLNL